jgi:hypothetical protein
MIKKNAINRIYTSFIVLALSLGLLFIYTTTIQPTQIPTPANAASTNTTQGAKSAANQTGEKMQGGAANVTQQGKSLMNKTGETLKSFANNTGEILQKINPLK